MDNKLTKKQTIGAALSHAIAFADEKLRNSRTINDEESTLFEEVRQATTIKDLAALTPKSWHQTPKDHHKKVITDFYRAMLKVVQYLDYAEHTDTEDRGWYRVWGSFFDGTGYFSEFDWGRDAEMALTFHKHGVITDKHMAFYRTKLTLTLAANQTYQTNGMPDAAKIVKSVQKEYVAKCLNIPLLYGFEVAAKEENQTLAYLKYT